MPRHLKTGSFFIKEAKVEGEAWKVAQQALLISFT